MASFTSCLRQEIRRRDAALAKMRAACESTWGTVQNAGFSTRELTPRAVVRKHPWAAMLGALALGFGLTVIARRLLNASHNSERAGEQAPQRVVVHVDGADAGKKDLNRAWTDLFAAALHGLPVFAAFVQGLQAVPQRETGRAPSSNDAPKVAAAVSEKTSGAEFKASISRRTAPPPRES